MDLSFFQGEAVVILRKTTSTQEDDYGRFKASVEEIEAYAVLGVTATNLDKQLSNVTERTTLTAFFDYGVTIFPDDKFIIRGTLWEKDGNALSDDSNIFAKSSLFNPPVKLTLKQVKGWVGQAPNEDEVQQTPLVLVDGEDDGEDQS